MSGPRHRYVAGALGGLSLVTASIGGLHLVRDAQGRKSMASASITGSLPTSCATSNAVTMCGQSPAKTEPANRTSGYRDGKYSVTGHYLTPGGAETIGVTLSLANGVVTATAVQVEAMSPTARQFQLQFASRYAETVTAKSLSEVSVSRVAGASLTSLGFDEAVSQIQAAARV